MQANYRQNSFEGSKGVVGNALGTIFIIKYAVAVEEPQEECGGNAFVAVAEGVILGNGILKHNRLSLLI